MNANELAPSGFPFLESLPPKIQAVLMESASLDRYQPGDIIFHQGEPANRFFLIESVGSPGTELEFAL